MTMIIDGTNGSQQTCWRIIMAIATVAQVTALQSDNAALKAKVGI